MILGEEKPRQTRDMMLTAEIHGPRLLRIRRAPVPDCGPDDALLRIHACGICGSDVHRYLVDAYGSRFQYPLNSGHEFAATVVAIGERVIGFHVGELVTGHSRWADCGGAFADYLLVPEANRNLISIEGTVSAGKADPLDAALVTLIEPLTVALNAIETVAAFSPSTPKRLPRIVIVGSGTIGLSVLLAAQARGYRDIVISEPSPLRRDIAKTLGARSVDPSGEGGLERLRTAVVREGEETESGADLVFECAGTTDSISQAIEIVVRGGTLAIVALSRTELGIPTMQIVAKSLTVKGITGAPLHQHAPEAIEILRSRATEAAQLVTHRFPLSDAKDAFELACDPHRCCKVLVEPT